MCLFGMALRERDLLVDLESGGTTTSEEEEEEEEGNKVPPSVVGVKQTKTLLGRVWNRFLSFDGGALRGEEGKSLLVNTSRSADVYPPENPKMLTENKFGERGGLLVLGEKKVVKEKRKKTSATKPPLPPRGPSLDAADMKLVREISELAMLKRARIERIRTLKKMRAAKATSSSSSMCAMVITILFCFVIIFQGMCSKSSSDVSFQGSPESRDGLISIQYNKNPSASDAYGTSARSPNFINQVAGSNAQEEEIKGAGRNGRTS